LPMVFPLFSLGPWFLGIDLGSFEKEAQALAEAIVTMLREAVTAEDEASTTAACVGARGGRRSDLRPGRPWRSSPFWGAFAGAQGWLVT